MDYKFIFTVLIFLINSSDCKYHKCETKPCISKCCSANFYIYESTCVSNNTIRNDFSDVNVYNSNLTIIGNLKDKFEIDYENFKEIIPNLPSLSFYILENGNLDLVLREENFEPQVTKISNDKFCVDYELSLDTFSLVYGIEFDKPPEKNITFSIIALVTSSIFLLSVLIIYAILKELRNLKGKILMATVLSLLCAFALLVTFKIISKDDTFQLSEEFCYGLTASIYFTFLSTFFWMNITSFDIWWTLRSMTSRRIVRSRGKWSKFKIYCVYGWGIPLIMAIALIVVDLSDLPGGIIKPNIVRNGCFLTDKPKLLYMDIPMLLVIISNWIFFIMTAYNFWCFGRDTEMLNSNNSSKHDRQKQRFVIYLKLSLIMGISWITEIISSYIPNLTIWYITDAYNMLIGISIFFIFVCKKDVMKKLSNRFNRHSKRPADFTQNTIQCSSSYA